MDIKAFQKFCFDFDIFPSVLSKAKTINFFTTLASFHTVSEKCIDEHLFVEALAMTAFEIIYNEPQPEPFEKILLLLEKMNQSEGPSKV